MYHASCNLNSVQGVPMTSLRFLFDGKRINDDETPKQVNQFSDFLFGNEKGGRIN